MVRSKLHCSIWNPYCTVYLNYRLSISLSNHTVCLYFIKKGISLYNGINNLLLNIMLLLQRFKKNILCVPIIYFSLMYIIRL